jgi:hypothetical protein
MQLLYRETYFVLSHSVRLVLYPHRSIGRGDGLEVAGCGALLPNGQEGRGGLLYGRHCVCR